MKALMLQRLSIHIAKHKYGNRYKQIGSLQDNPTPPELVELPDPVPPGLYP